MKDMTDVPLGISGWEKKHGKVTENIIHAKKIIIIGKMNSTFSS